MSKTADNNFRYWWISHYLLFVCCWFWLSVLKGINWHLHNAFEEFIIGYCSVVNPAVSRSPSMPEKRIVSCRTLTILSMNKFGFFVAGPPHVVFTSFLYSMKVNLALDVKFLHLSLTFFSVLGATPNELLLVHMILQTLFRANIHWYVLLIFP